MKGKQQQQRNCRALGNGIKDGDGDVLRALTFASQLGNPHILWLLCEVRQGVATILTQKHHQHISGVWRGCHHSRKDLGGDAVVHAVNVLLLPVKCGSLPLHNNNDGMANVVIAINGDEHAVVHKPRKFVLLNLDTSVGVEVGNLEDAIL